MISLETQNRKWWAYEIRVSPRTVLTLQRGAGWAAGLLAVPLGILYPVYITVLLIVLQITSEPDLIGGYEGLDGFASMMFGIPAGLLGAILGVALPSPWRRRFLVSVAAIQALLIVLGLADMYRYELIR